MTIKALYPTVRPTLNLDFAKTKALDPRVTFTRASTATYVGADGLIKTAASGAARFDHNPATGESLGLLVEEARTNELADSMPTTSGGSGSGITNTAVTGLPGDFSTGRRLTTGGGNDVRIIVGSNTLNVVFAYSFFARAGTQGSYIFLRNGTGSYASWNLITNTVTRDDFGTSRIIDYGNGWYRCYSVITGNGTSGFLLGVGDSSLNSVNGDNIIIAGVQVEQGAFPTSYIPTSGSTVTRAADVASMTGGNFSSWYRQDEGTILGVCRNPLSGTQTCVGFDDATSSNQLNIYSDTTTGYMTVVAAGSVVANLTLGTLSSSNKNQFCGTYKLNSYAATLNSGSVLTDTSGAVPAITQLRIGKSQGGSSLFGTISRLAYYPVRLPDAQLQALTAT
jgi:hypothetical protein